MSKLFAPLITITCPVCLKPFNADFLLAGITSEDEILVTYMGVHDGKLAQIHFTDLRGSKDDAVHQLRLEFRRQGGLESSEDFRRAVLSGGLSTD